VNKNLENLDTLILFTQASLATLKLFFAGIVKKGSYLNMISLFSLPNARYSNSLESFITVGQKKCSKFFS
jgi:hypothetical protein